MSPTDGHQAQLRRALICVLEKIFKWVKLDLRPFCTLCLSFGSFAVFSGRINGYKSRWESGIIIVSK